MSASADEIHGYGCDADCSAGMCAWSRENSHHLRGTRQSGTVLTQHASQRSGQVAAVACKRPSNGTGHRQTGQTDPNSGGLRNSGRRCPPRHAEQDGEYRRLAWVATPRLLASRFASQFQAATAAGNVARQPRCRKGAVVGVTGHRCFCAQSVDICVEATEVPVSPGTAAEYE